MNINTGKFAIRTIAAGFVAITIVVLGASLPVLSQVPSLIYSFDAADNGIYGPFPASVMAQGRDGNLYGTTDSGGINNVGGVFMVTPLGAETTLHVFSTAEGQHCNMGLTLGNDGNFYGACYDGVTSNEGEVYEITPSGVLTILHSFTNTGGDGASPNAPPIQASDGNFYGTTIGGGANGDGTIYKMTPNGNVTILHSILYPAEGGSPATALVQASDGNLYGTTEEGAVIFRITGAGKFTVLHTFAVTGDGALPLGALIQGKDGSLYGTTQLDGTNAEGTVFKLTPAGAFSVLESFNAASDGQGDPWVGLVQATDGNFYGVTFRFGLPLKNQYGGIYKITSKGVYSSLYLFDGTVGANPASALIQHTNGLLYGNAQNNGGFDVGSVYSVNVGAAPFCSLLMSSGKIGATIGVLGQGFTSSSVVRFGGVKASVVTLMGSTYVSAAVPAGALSGSVTVTTGTSKLTGKQAFRVTPMIKTFSPPSGPIGTNVTITGSGLTQATKVMFNGTSASFVVDSDTQVTATVPVGATTGKISVVTIGGSASTAANFTVI